MSSDLYREFRIQSSLSSSAALDRLASATEKSRWFHWSDHHRLFQGTLKGNRFEIQRIVRERNSTLPRMRGEIAPTARGTSIVGVMQLAGWIRPFLIFCISFVSVAWFATILVQLFSRTFNLFGTIIPVALLGFLIGFLRSLPRDFLSQTEAEVRYLAELVDASRVEWASNADDTVQGDVDRSRERPRERTVGRRGPSRMQ
jgi:hypothetical protein